MHNKNILIFPINISTAVEYSRIARELDFHVIEASSDFDEEVAARGNVFSLPYVSEASFNKAFEALLQAEQIGVVYTPHPGIWNHLTFLSRDGNFSTPFRISNVAPLQAEWDLYAKAYDFGNKCREHNRSTSGGAGILPDHLYANLYKDYHQIPGQCDDQKLLLLTRIAREAPEGDIVEIGSLYGRSAFALAWLSKKYQIGPVICIDPWKEINIVDQGEQAAMLNDLVKIYDLDQIFSGFIASLSGFDHVNYIRQPSVTASVTYAQLTHDGEVSSEEFGVTPISGKISILHIDGNHKYEEVKQDVECWLPKVVSNGWILLDDYLWAFGDGPHRVGNELLAKLQVKQSFVMGDTLCIQL